MSAAEAIGNALLYEGYILYPYRAVSVKNQSRWTFGGIYPAAYSRAQTGSDASHTQTEVMVRGHRGTRVSLKLRFLQLSQRTAFRLKTPAKTPPVEDGLVRYAVPELHASGRTFPTWQEAIEHEVSCKDLILGDLLERPHVETFVVEESRSAEPVFDTATNAYVGVLVRESKIARGSMTISARPLGADAYRVAVRVSNDTLGEVPSGEREAALFHTLLSAHTVLTVCDGRFVSLTDPGERFAEHARACRNEGTWPVLVGRPEAEDTMLSSPIVLYDYPRVSPESPGDLFDATEIDEILTLRILTLTDQEKREMRALDPRASALLDRTEALGPRDLMNLHGKLESLGAPSGVSATGRRPGRLSPGDRVRICPRGRADVMDIVLRGRVATVRAIEQDFEDRVHVVVTIDDDPGADLGIAGQVGHRFFYAPDDLELLESPRGVA